MDHQVEDANNSASIHQAPVESHKCQLASLVECAEVKLMRRRQECATSDSSSQATTINKQIGSADKQHQGDTATRQHKRAPAKWLKSPAFSTLTLNEQDLERLQLHETTTSFKDKFQAYNDDSENVATNNDRIEARRRRSEQPASKKSDCNDDHDNALASVLSWSRRKCADATTSTGHKDEHDSGTTTTTSCSMTNRHNSSSTTSAHIHLADLANLTCDTERQKREGREDKIDKFASEQRKRLSETTNSCGGVHLVARNCSDDRGGPTPTNDLVRALHERDRQALGAKHHRQRRQTSPNCCDIPLGIALSATTEATTKVLLHDDNGGAINLNCNGQAPAALNANQVIEMNERRHSCATQNTSALLTGNDDADDYEHSSLSPLRLAARAIETMQAAAARGAHRSSLVLSTASASDNKSLLMQNEERRHSAYMLPLLLLDRRRRATTSESDDDDDDDDDDADISNFEHHSEIIKITRQKSTTRSKIESEQPPPPQAVKLQTNRRQDDCDDDDDDTCAMLMNSLGLPSSISSPSALSTPTNHDNDDGGGGCGGPCCSERARLLQLAAENASLARQLFSSNDTRAGGHSPAPAAAGARRRFGSNPLDRMVRPTASGVQPVTTTKAQQNRSTTKTTTTTNKRHSIINLFAGGGGGAQNANTRHRSFAFAHPLHAAGAATSMPANDRDRDRNRNCNEQRNQPARRTSDVDDEHATPIPYEPLIPESGFKIVVMGSSHSGKTSLIQRFLYGTFSSRHTPTVEDTYFIEFPHKKHVINISVSDTSGTYQFPAMKKLAINSGDAFILVYSVDDPNSFDYLEQLRETILNEREQAYLDSIVALPQQQQQQQPPLDSSMSPPSGSVGGGGGGTTFKQHQTSHAASLSHQAAASASQSNNSLSVANQRQDAAPHLSPSRHWSLASLFNHNQHNQQQQQQHNAINSHGSSICGSTTTSTSSCSSSTDNSRRSSISAAEAALRTRRTRKPPMVIVANKHDLPRDQHAVNSDEIEALAVIDWDNGFVRASAALNWNVDEVFQQVLKQARQPPTLTEAIVSKRRKSLPPKLPHP